MIVETYENDDPLYEELVNSLISGIAEKFQPKRINITRIDNWFGKKWLAFSGKVLGAIGVWDRNRVTIPPFVENRITSQSLYVYDSASHSYVYSGEGDNIHHSGPSSENLQRTAKLIAPETALFWYSGNSKGNQKASFMGYIPSAEGWWGFYMSFSCNGTWTPWEKINIRESEANMFMSSEGSLKCT